MSCTGCCTCPHGRMTIYATILAASAFLFTLSATNGCYFMETNVRFSDALRVNGQRVIVGNDANVGVGLFTYEDAVRSDTDEYECFQYTDDMIEDFDGAFVAARAFGVLTIIFTGGGLLMVLISTCVEFTVKALRGISLMFFLGSFFILFTYCIFGSDMLCDSPATCQFSVGAGLVICGIVLDVSTGIVAYLMPEAIEALGGGMGGDVAHEQPQAFAPGTQTVTETIMPDGKKKITKTTVNPDGSQTVEETYVDVQP